MADGQPPSHHPLGSTAPTPGHVSPAAPSRAIPPRNKVPRGALVFRNCPPACWRRRLDSAAVGGSAHPGPPPTSAHVRPTDRKSMSDPQTSGHAALAPPVSGSLTQR